MYDYGGKRERITSYNSAGRPTARCNHPYWGDVSPIKDTFNREAEAALQRKFTNDCNNLKVKLQSARVLYAVGAT